MTWLETVHFLRPGWLLSALPAVWILLRILRRGSARKDWQAHVDSHLLDHLLTGGTAGHRWKPAVLLGILWLMVIVALAGPAWRREPSPFARDAEPLLILLKVTPSMLEDDLAPSRLERATHKISDLLSVRPGARTGLIAYAGSAHLVMPLTVDASAITLFTEGVGPDIMPRAGDAPDQAIQLARRMLEGSGGGSLLLITDETSADSIAAARRALAEDAPPLHVWAAIPGDSKDLARLARSHDGRYAAFTSDLSDVHALAAAIRRTARSQPADGGDRWRDEGYWLTPFLALGMLYWFRKGWVLP